MEMACAGKIDPSKLPPTDDAARLHGFCALHQTLNWLSLEDNVSTATQWGWTFEEGALSPIKSEKAVAPPEMERLIRCKCSLSADSPCSKNTCTCRKYGLKCSAACKNCCGQECSNSKVS